MCCIHMYTHAYKCMRTRVLSGQIVAVPVDDVAMSKSVWSSKKHQGICTAIVHISLHSISKSGRKLARLLLVDSTASLARAIEDSLLSAVEDGTFTTMY